MLKKKIFNYQNKTILTNGAIIYTKSIKYIKNYELNKTLFNNSLSLKDKKLKDNLSFFKLSFKG